MTSAAAIDPLSLAVAVSNLVVGVGTLITVIVAVATLRSQIQEKQLDQIRNVRAWLVWEREGDGVEGGPDLDQYRGQGVVRNESEAPVYKLRYRVMLGSPKRVQNVTTTFHLLPGQEHSQPTFNLYDSREIDRFQSDRVNVPGFEVAFSDSSGRRWHRSRDGSLSRIQPLRWFAPWRTVPPIDFDVLVLNVWTLRANWQYRQKITDHRYLVSGPPPWFAADIRWKRWRAAAERIPVNIPWWKWRDRHAAEHRISQERIDALLPLPWWAFRARKSYAKAWRRNLVTMDNHLRQSMSL